MDTMSLIMVTATASHFVSADKRRVPVLALSDEGSMHLADTTNIPGLSWYLNDHLTAMDVSGSILNPSIPIDTTLHQFDPYLNPRKTEYCEPLSSLVSGQDSINNGPTTNIAPKLMGSKHWLVVVP